MRKVILLASALLCCNMVSFAQNVQKREQYSSFNAISIHNSFEVTLVSKGEYSVYLDVDGRVADYCRAYLQGGTLVIEMDEKGMPKELKSSLKKTPALSFQAEISIPSLSAVQNINLFDAAVLKGNGSFDFSNNVTVTTDGTSSVKSFDVHSPGITFKTSRKSNVYAKLDVTNVDLNSGNNSFVILDVKNAKSVSVDAGAMSQVSISGTSSDMVVKSSSSAKVNVNATLEKLTVIGKGNSSVDAHSSSVKDADIDLTSSDCWVVPEKTMRIKLVSGGKLVFGGSPKIEINKISNSSVLRESDSKGIKSRN